MRPLEGARETAVVRKAEGGGEGPALRGVYDVNGQNYLWREAQVAF